MRLHLFRFEIPVSIGKIPDYPVSDDEISRFCLEVDDIETVFKEMEAADV